MPRPDRVSRRRERQESHQPIPTGGIRDDIKALNSSILLITQKMKYLVRNEKILGRNLIVLNKKIKTISEKMSSDAGQQATSVASSEELNALKGRIEALETEIEELMERSASKEDMKELKYVINSINPLEFATLSQVRDMIDKRLEEMNAKKKTA